MHGATARVARASRIFVEGKHDAELVEKVWGDDLRVEGVVVELLDGVDDLADVPASTSAPARAARSGSWSTTSCPARRRAGSPTHRRSPVGKHVLVVGHPFVDVWAAVKPERIGLERWPDIPRDVEWKKGVCAALGWPHAEQADIARAWKQILSRVDSFADCEPALLGRVEELIDFVTVD